MGLLWWIIEGGLDNDRVNQSQTGCKVTSPPRLPRSGSTGIRSGPVRPVSGPPGYSVRSAWLKICSDWVPQYCLNELREIFPKNVSKQLSGPSLWGLTKKQGQAQNEQKDARYFFRNSKSLLLKRQISQSQLAELSFMQSITLCGIR